MTAQTKRDACRHCGRREQHPVLPWCLACWDRLPRTWQTWFAKARTSATRHDRYEVCSDHLRLISLVEGK